MKPPIAPTAPPSRRGVVLPLLLALLLALTLLAHGALLLARREYLATRAFLSSVRADLAASGAVFLAVNDPLAWTEARVPGVEIPLGSGWIGPDLWRGGYLRWLGPELHLVEGKGRSRGWPGVRERGAVGWALDPLTRIGSMSAGLELGGRLTLDPRSDVSASDPLGTPGEWEPEDCAWYAPMLDSLLSGRRLPLSAPLPPLHPGEAGSESGIPPLGFHSGPGLMAIARELGFLNPAPVPSLRGSGCPDSGEAALIGSEFDLDLRNARICGLLVVAGDLRIGREGTFQGLALVGGDLLVEESGHFEGMARVAGSVSAGEAATLRILACPALRALSEKPALLKPLLLPGAWNFPLY